MPPAPGLYTCIKSWKKLYKIRLQRDFFETCNRWVKLNGVFVDIKILSPGGCLHQSLGYIHVKNYEKNGIKLELKEIFFKLARNDQSDKMFLLTSKFCPQGVVNLCPDPIYMYKIMKKNCIKSVFKEICLKLVANDRSDKRFLLTSKFCLLGLSVPDLRLYTFIKSWKDVYTSCQRLKRFFLNLQQMTIVMRPTCWYKFLALIGCLPLPKGYV